ncbi:MAG: precorrin-4 C(11)-methyltransferase [Planctomycetes bacterium]|nr:precorrin-4 C(11)-methyltransferase [Planctomycetota bacterium]
MTPKVLFVGAGPGDPTLLTLKAADALRNADVVIFTGSLVPERVFKEFVPSSAEVLDSKSMELDALVTLMVERAKAGKRVVRLHTGDPCLFGAVREQVRELALRGVAVEIVPGISSFQAAAAAMGIDLTVPDVSQALILTRAAGRTPVPARESLVELGKHGSTLCLYLSTNLADEVQKDLLACYPPETPVAVAYKVSWPEEKIVRGRLDGLAALCSKEKIKMHALILVGPSLGEHKTRSKLYDPAFAHKFRKARKKAGE